MPNSSSASETASTTTDRKLTDLELEALERLTESIPPTLGLAKLIATDNMNKLLAAARRRTDDGHRAQMLKLQETTGQPFDLSESTEDEEVAISVQGDTNHYTTAAASGMSGAAKLAAAALVGSALPLAGVGVYELLSDKAPAVVQPAEPAPAFTDRDTYVPYELSIE